ncbi:MAG TPA: hypothetical protein VKG82_07630 [Solirubrobacteraceae bacterium]|nr:hypothetical protein [Solirubrobacteraceae bacterium]
MGENADIYTATVRLLRDVSRNHAAAAAEMCNAPAEGSAAVASPAHGVRSEAIVAALLAGPPRAQVANLGEMLRALEDVGLEAVCRLSRARDEAAAFDAIEEANASWLRGAVLNRAAETFGRG